MEHTSNKDIKISKKQKWLDFESWKGRNWCNQYLRSKTKPSLIVGGWN